MSASLSRRFPHLHAWGIEIGSLRKHVQDQAKQALRDGVPSDVYYHHQWTDLPESRRDELLALDDEAGVEIVREGGTPVRVWYRVRRMPPGEARDRVQYNAGRLAAGEPAYRAPGRRRPPDPVGVEGQS